MLNKPTSTPSYDPLRATAYSAEKLRVHPATVHRAIKAGRIKAIPISARCPHPR
jgi:hypothetical protein